MELSARHAKWANIQTIRVKVIVNYAGQVAGQMAPDRQAAFHAIEVHFLMCQGQRLAQVAELPRDFLLFKDLPFARQGNPRAMRDIT
jgi:hypothetical protein